MRSSCSAPSSPAASRAAAFADGQAGGISIRTSPLALASSSVVAGTGSLPSSPHPFSSKQAAAGGVTLLAAPWSHPAHTRQLQLPADDSEFRSGVQHAGWLWKRFGHGHRTKWKRLWFWLEGDRLHYCEAEARAATAAPLSDTSSSLPAGVRLGSSSPLLGSSLGSTAALTAGAVKYICIDRIPSRPLPHRQHELDPGHSSHPDIGVAIIDNRVLTGQPANSPKRAVLSLVTGSHTHYLAAESMQEAQSWVSAMRQTWLHCFSHTARATGTVSGAAGAAVSQHLMAENALLRESIDNLNQQVSRSEGEYWRRWVKEKAKNSVLESRLVNVASYELLVRTANIKGAGTDARCYLELFGPEFTPGTIGCSSGGGAVSPSAAPAAATVPGVGGEVRLLDLDSAAKPCQRGAVDAFTVLCQDVGLPTRLRVWHDNTGKHPDWFLLDIRVCKKGAKDFVSFPCNRWLSAQLDDCRISRELVAGSSKPTNSYRVVVVTSDTRGAGTDADVLLQLHGLLGDGRRQQLQGGANDFDRAARNEFLLDDADLGELTAVTVSLQDSSGRSPSWHCDHILVTPLMLAGTPGSTGAAAAAAAAAGGTSPASPPASGPSSPVSTTHAAGSPRCNSSSRSRAAAARSSSSSLRSSLEPSAGAEAGLGSSSHRALLEGRTYIFPCNAWLDERLGGGCAQRRLPAASSLAAKVWYKLAITTSDVRGAGTDADVSVTLIGSDGSSDRVQLPSGPEHFERGQRDEFRLQLPHLGKLQKLVIGHNNKGDSPSWHLAVVEVVEEETGAVTFYSADRWLGEAAPDGLSQVTLTACSEDPRKAVCDYQVCFLTSPLRGAGTDSTVSFELRGSAGSSGPITVSAGKEAFERGGSDTFTYKRPWLGRLQSLAVWHDNAGTANVQGPWHLEAVVVSVSCSSKEQQVVTFPCGRWLSAETQLRVELCPGDASGLARYRFEVVTSSVRGAGTDGAVILELCGAGGGAARAGPWCLDKPGAFGRGQTDAFCVEGVAVGEPASLLVRLRPGALNSDWHLSHVVCSLVDGEDCRGKCFFVANRWFDAAHGWESILTASSKPPEQPEAALLPYVLRVFTSDIKGAGTDAAVSVNLVGARASSGWQELQARPDALERGKDDVFTLHLPDLGPLSHLGVRSDGSGPWPAWHLDKVCVLLPASTVAAGPAASAPHGLPTAAGQHGSARAAAVSRQLSRAGSSAEASSRTPHGGGGGSALLLLAMAGAAGSPPAASGHGVSGPRVWFPAQLWLDAAHGLEVLLEAQSTDPAQGRVSYHVQAFTSNIRQAGSDGQVFLQLFGERVSSRPQELAGSPFERGCRSEFVLQLPQLGALSKARLWVERGPPWHLELLIVTAPDGAVSYFPCGAWLGITDAAGAPGTAGAPLELPAEADDPRSKTRQYTVLTRTSDLRGAGTDAQVHVELLDAAGNSSGRQVLATAGPEAFERGRVDSFSLVCPALGELAQLRIGTDGSGQQPGWHLLQAEVTDVAAGRTWYFEADCWFDASHGDGRIERLLLASTTDPLAQRCTYRVTVHTSNKPGAGTNGAVFITLHGSPGMPTTSAVSKPGRHNDHDSTTQPSAAPTTFAASGLLTSGRHELRSGNRAGFGAGGAGSFNLPAMRSLGQLRQLTLELAEAVGCSEPCSWHCQHLEVTNTNTGESWLFPCNTWLGSPAAAAGGAAAPGVGQSGPDKQQGGQNQLVLYPASLDAVQQQQQLELELQRQERLRVQVFTSDLPGAGTDASVAITLYGAAGKDRPFQLAKGFKRGSCDTFEVVSQQPLGQLLRLKVVSDGAGAAAAWHLDTIAVTSSSSGATTWFFADRSLDIKSGLQAELQGSAVDARTQLVKYKVTTHTSDIAGAGTNARVSIELHSSSGGSSGPQQLDRPVASSNAASSNCFERGHWDAFEVRCQELSQLSELVVALEGGGLAAAWHLAYVEVQHLGTGQVWYFPCCQWLGAKHGDAAVRRWLKATDSNDPAGFTCGYRLAITTGNVRGGGTDARVFVQMHGARGDTGRVVLDTAGRGNCFERGRTDEFRVTALDVGQMSHIVVGHDGSGLGPAWLLAAVEVEHLGSGQLLRFTADRWLDSKREDGALHCELWPAQPTSQQQQQQQQQVAWELVVTTGRVFGAGTDADVFVELHGQQGVFGPHILPAGPEAFEAGCRDCFQLHTPELGPLTQVVIGHNNNGQGAAWFLQGLELTNTATGAVYVFKVASWLNLQNGCSRALKAVPQAQASGPLGVPGVAASLGGAGAAGSPGLCSYQLEIQTSDVEGAATDAAVFVQLIGASGAETPAMQLQAAGGSGNGTTGGGLAAVFQRGCLDVFVLRGLADTGPLAFLRIGHDGSGQHPAWHLSWVRVVNLTTGSRAMFSCNAWLDPHRPDCASWVQLPAGPDVQAPAGSVSVGTSSLKQLGQLGGTAMVLGGTVPEGLASTGGLKLRSWLHSSKLGQPGYEVVFTTSNIWCAGTGSRVFVELIGEHGSSGVMFVSAQAGQFARGHSASFIYPRLPYLGPLLQLRVGTDGQGVFAAWHLRQVEVTHVHSGQRWRFECHDWIDRRSGWMKLLPSAAVPVAGAAGSAALWATI